MGLASSIGLGLALARPDLVFVLDGDGSLLMNLGSLATIGLPRPPNLVLIVMDNEEYATTGGQQTPTAHGADLEAAARAMRIADAVTVRTEEELTRAIERARVIVAKVDESAPIAKPPLDCVFIKHRFMTAIGSQDGPRRQVHLVIDRPHVQRRQRSADAEIAHALDLRLLHGHCPNRLRPMPDRPAPEHTATIQKVCGVRVRQQIERVCIDVGIGFARVNREVIIGRAGVPLDAVSLVARRDLQRQILKGHAEQP